MGCAAIMRRCREGGKHMSKRILSVLLAVLFAVSTMVVAAPTASAEEDKTLTLLADPPQGGTVIGGGTYAYGTSATATAVPNPGYVFDYWSEWSGGEEYKYYKNPLNLTAMLSNYTVTAVFKQACEVYVDVEPAEGGTVTGDGTYAYGADVTLTAVPNDGYVFDGWYHMYDDGEVHEVLDSKESPYVISGIDCDVWEIAKFKKLTNTLSTSASPAEGGTVTGGGTYAYGASATLTAVPNPGYVFDYWSEWSDGVEYKNYNNPRTLTAVLGNYTVTAVFKQACDVYVDIEPAGGGTVTGEGTYAYGDDVTLTAVPNEGYVFDGWYHLYENGEKTEEVLDSKENPYVISGIDSNVWEIAKFTKNTYTLTVTASPAEGGTVTGGGTFAYGTKTKLTAVPNEGYEFSGWYVENELITDKNPVTMMLSEPYDYAELTAVFVRKGGTNGYTIIATASPAEGGTVTGSGTYAYDAVAKLTAVPNEGYTFDGWYYEGKFFADATNNPLELQLDETYNYMELTAVFVRKAGPSEYTIVATASPAEGGTVTGGGTYPYGTNAELTAVPNEGYEFAGWYSDDELLTDKNPVTISLMEPYEFAELTAKFMKNAYTVTVTASPAEGGTVTGGGTYDYGAEVTLTASPKTGYVFDGWYALDDENDEFIVGDASTYTIRNLDEDHSLIAKFSKSTYTVTVTASPAEGGTVNGAGSYEYGVSAVLNAAPNEGYTFDGWYEGGTKLSGEAAYSFPVEKNVSLTAKFTQNTYTLTALASPAAGGSATVIGGSSFAHGASATVTAVANDGYTFDGWYAGGVKVSDQDVYTLTVTNALILTAKFTKITCTVAVNASPEAGGSASGAGVYDQGATATVTAATNSGYHFLGWYEGATKLSDSASYTFTVTKSVTLTAKYEKDAPPAAINIQNFVANKSVDYRTTITFTAVVENPVAGAAVRWFVDGQDVGSGETYTVKEAKKDFNVQAKYVSGSEVLAESGVESVQVNSGFFTRLKAFFRGLFGRLPKVVQEYLGIEIIDRVFP